MILNENKYFGGAAFVSFMTEDQKSIILQEAEQSFLKKCK
jgi:hypothetical protein